MRSVPSVAEYGVCRLLPLSDPKAEWHERLHMIREARHFIYASTYFLQHDRYGLEYVAALQAACRRGVNVTLVIDGFGQVLSTSLMSKKEIQDGKKALRELSALGARVVFYQLRSPLKRILGSGNHIKIQLSDAGTALFASGNISATSYEQWREFSVLVEGKIVARLLEEFCRLGVVVCQEHKNHLEGTVSTGKTLGYLSHHPTLDRHWLNPICLKEKNRLTHYLADVIRNAQTHIALTTLYFKPAPVLVDAMIAAANRGVKIEIFHSHAHALGVSMLPWIPSFYLYEQLCAAGIDIYERPACEHSKIMLVDDALAAFGSYNFEYAADDRLAEAMMISADPLILEHFRQVFTGLRQELHDKKVTCPKECLLNLTTWQKMQLWGFKPWARWI